MKRYALLAFVILLCLHAHSQSAAMSDTASKSFTGKAIGLCEKILHALTIEKDSWEMAVYPAASYADRTGLSVGVMPMIRLKHAERPWTTITPSALVSTKGMFEVQCDADVYLTRRSTITAKAEFFYLPDDFYNVGNQRRKSVEATMNVYRSLFTCDFYTYIYESRWQIGATTDFCNHKYKNIDGEEAARVEMADADGWDNGLGPLIAYDNRDDKLYPRSGWLLKFRYLYYGKWLGGQHVFSNFTADVRRYIAIGDESVLAMQAYAQLTGSNAPFHHKSTFAGTRLARAIGHNLKYVDNAAWLMQGEFRFPLFWRIGAVAWAGAGNATHTADKILYDAHLIAGGGLRFKVFPKQGLNIRLDGGYSSRGEGAIYFNIREAF